MKLYCALLLMLPLALLAGPYEEAVRSQASGQYAEAAAGFQGVLGAEPGNLRAWQGLAFCRYRQGDKAGALAAYDSYLKLKPGDTQVATFARRLRSELAAPAAAAPQEEVRWQEYRAAKKLSEESGKPLLIDFTAAWCGPCKVLDREVFKDPRHAAYINQSFIPVRAVDERREKGHNHFDVQQLQQRHKLEGFPTLVVCRPNNTRAKKQLGYPGAEGTRAFLENALQNIKR